LVSNSIQSKFRNLLCAAQQYARSSKAIIQCAGKRNSFPSFSL
jgi:hypothetical protein